jgi:cytochrome c
MKNLLLLTASVLAYPADPSSGKMLFESKCGICHATDTSERRMGPGLRAAKEGTLPSHKNATHDVILEQIQDGGGGMPAFRGLLTKDQKEDLVAYVLTLTASPHAYPGDPSSGKTLFESKCAICHATDSSERRIGPGLKGLKDGVLPSRRNGANEDRNTTHDVVLHQIENGGGGMPVFRDLLTKEQKDDIVAYVLTL